MTETITYLEQRLDEARTLLSTTEGQDDFASRLGRQSMEQHVDDLQQQLRSAKAERETEVVELRLLGEIAKAGALPLNILGEIATDLSRALHAASYYVRSGRELVSRVPSDITHSLNLRFADVQPGSTRLFITGTLSPDLFGRSLLEESLDGTFELLRASSDDDLEDAVSSIGFRSVRKLGELLETLDKAGLAAEVKWDSPQGDRLRWEGSQQDIRRLTQSLKRLRTTEPEHINVRGQIIALSLKGRFELRVRDEEEDRQRTYRGTFPARLNEDVQQVRLGQEVVARLEVSKVVNEATGHSKTRYALVALDEPGELYAGPEPGNP